MRSHLLAIPLVALALVLLGAYVHLPTAEPALGFAPHPPPALFADTTLPSAYNVHFAAAGACRKCHGLDTAGVAMVDAAGQDVNVVDDWRSTTMANAAKDPFWRAQMSLETTVFPQHKASIEHTCTRCHAPLGHFDAVYTGNVPYVLDQLLTDPVGLDGVSCMACHSQRPDSLSAVHSGALRLDTERRIYGPYPMPLVSPMLTATSFEPVYGLHIRRAEACGTCHSLVTHTLDDAGNPTGQHFVEQATWHEWLNSTYPAQAVRCQDCHMTSLGKTPVDIAANSNTTLRQPFFRHDLVGANLFMLRLMKAQRALLEIKAGPAHFDETIAATLEMLQHRSLQLQVEEIERTADSALLRVELTNLAGHKLPSGYPSRRMFISVIAQTAEGDTLFASGMWNDTFALEQIDLPFEPHHDTIRSEQQVQIYEMVMADADGQPTTVLKKAAYPLKDNRLPPVGFSMSHYTADTTRIVGAALWDDDFNFEGGQEGSGTDRVWYQIPLAGYAGAVWVHVAVWYQAVPPEWVAALFATSTPAIDQFEAMYAAADRAPVRMRDTLLLLLPPLTAAPAPPAPAPFARCYLRGEVLSIEATTAWTGRLWAADGRLLRRLEGGPGVSQIALPAYRGLMLVQLRSEGRTCTFKLVRR